MADFDLRVPLDFLSELALHNDRDWFQAHKDWYTASYQQFTRFSEAYIAGLSLIDDTLAGLQAKDCIWRIYRDVRFSADKRPYKEWFGVFPAAKGGKKSLHGGYYIHVEPGNCLLACGCYCLPTNILTACRNEIMGNIDTWRGIVEQPLFVETLTP